MKTGIYILTNKINGKQYIGQAYNINNRWGGHKSSKDDYPICRAIRKYGWENFEKEILIIVDKVDLDFYEIKCIDVYNTLTPNGYNVNEGGQGKGKPQHPRSKSTRQKISKAHKGKKGHSQPMETRQKIREALLGRPNPNKGKTYEEIMGKKKAAETRKKQSEALVRKPNHPQSLETRKKIGDLQRNISFDEKFGLERSQKIKRKLKKAQRQRRIRERIQKDSKRN
jgi:group I intron endonuclease